MKFSQLLVAGICRLSSSVTPALTITTLVAYDDNVSILLALMAAVVAMAEQVTAVQVPTSSPALSLFHTFHPTNCSLFWNDLHTDTHSDMESDADSIKACVNSHACHLYCSIVMMTSAKVERQRRYIARINADPQKREQFLMRDRLRKKKKVMMTENETKHGYRKQPEIQRIQLKNKLVLVDPRVLDKPFAIGGYKEIDKSADALSKTLLNTNISRIYGNESISEDGVGDEKAKLYSHALSQYNNNKNNMLCEMPEETKVEQADLQTRAAITTTVVEYGRCLHS